MKMKEKLEVDMSGRICLVTGATNGIGKATAQALAQMGATVVIVGRNAPKTAQLVAEIRTDSGGNKNVDSLNGYLWSKQIRQR
jgi:NAD(P)-dependent dehydrogenase (short-subunit alcohol dehydrogenase family)